MSVSRAPVKVVVVDDSVVIRRVLHDLLSNDPDVEVVGTASNGKLGLDKIRATQPDIVILDIEMPVMDGLTTLKHLREEFPRLPVVMFSTLTTRGGSATLDALALGATDYLTKPESLGGRDHAIESIRSEMLPKVKVLGRMPGSRVRPAPLARPAAPLPAPRPATTARVDIVAVAVSTGGPRALQDIVPRLPGNLPVPMVLVQHMPPVFTGLLAERLDRASAIRVVEAESGMHLEAGTLYIAPGGRHLVLRSSPRGNVTELNDDAPENSCRPSADPLFRSVVNIYGAHTLGVVLTGMGSDGCKGSEAIVKAGGEVIAQDEATSVVWGMPGAVVQHGLVSAVVPLGRVVDEITARTAHGHTLLNPAGARR